MLANILVGLFFIWVVNKFFPDLNDRDDSIIFMVDKDMLGLEGPDEVDMIMAEFENELVPSDSMEIL